MDLSSTYGRSEVCLVIAQVTGRTMESSIFRTRMHGHAVALKFRRAQVSVDSLRGRFTDSGCLRWQCQKGLQIGPGDVDFESVSSVFRSREVYEYVHLHSAHLFGLLGVVAVHRAYLIGLVVMTGVSQDQNSS